MGTSTFRVGVQAPVGSPGQVVDFEGGDFATAVSIVNVGADAVQYTLDGTNWISVAGGATANLSGAISQALFKLRKGVAGAYPAPVDMTVTSDAVLSPNQTAAVQSLVSGAGYPLTPRLIGGGVDIAGSRTITNAGPIALASVVIPGGSIGAIGQLRIRGRFFASGNVNNKTLTVVFGGVTLMTSGPGLTGALIWPFDFIIVNRGSEASQSWHPSAAGSLASANTAIGTSTVNTAVDQTLEIRGTVVTESLTLEYFTVEVQRFA